MEISFITTVLNEEKIIGKLLESLFSQTRLPDEIIIVDGGSTDNTLEKIKKYLTLYSSSETEVKSRSKSSRQARTIITNKVFVKNGNRSAGRNEAIKKASGDIIVCSDAGNILHRKWIENITHPFQTSPQPSPKSRGGIEVDVVAGYYKGLPKNVFQKCLVPYALVMPDKVDTENFLPATRSVAFKKSIWEKAGGFDEKLSHNEDYAFARRLKEIDAKIVFAKDAIVNWIPRNTYKEAFIMFFRFAFGDAETGILRTNVLILFARYFLGLYFIFLTLLYKSFIPLVLILISVIFYVGWAIKKNYKYVRENEAFRILPLLQFTSDAAVLFGTTFGLLKKVKQKNYFLYIKQNKFLFFVLAVYVRLLLQTLTWGIPNQDHPFPYHMDEWHQFGAVANTFRYGSPNNAGAANGTMLHFLLTGFYLIPFILVKIIDPFSLHIDNSFMRERFFEILRLNTILWGSLSIFLLYKISGALNASKKLSIFLFTFTPILLMLSGYFKYDIALIFWILLSLHFFFRFAKNPTNQTFVLASIPSALAFSVKVSAIPLLVIYAFSYFWFHPSWKKSFKYLLLGVGVYIGCIILFGMPDTLFGKGNILLYLYENIIQSPGTTSNFQTNINPYLFLLIRHYPIIFGHGLFILFIVSCLFWFYILNKKFITERMSLRGGTTKQSLSTTGLPRSLSVAGNDNYKIILFIFFSLIIFAISLLPLQIWAAGNRSLVLLPFMVLIIALSHSKLTSQHQAKLWLILIVFMSVIQVYESLAWFYMKTVKSPQEVSSRWIQKNIIKGEIIGIENIPIYQELPDIIEKEFYYDQAHIKQDMLYTYQVIDEKSNKLPSTIVLTNAEINDKILKLSLQKKLLRKIEQEKYRKVVIFSPDFTYSKIMVNDKDYYFSGLLAAPLTISIYRK